MDGRVEIKGLNGHGLLEESILLQVVGAGHERALRRILAREVARDSTRLVELEAVVVLHVE